MTVCSGKNTSLTQEETTFVGGLGHGGGRYFNDGDSDVMVDGYGDMVIIIVMVTCSGENILYSRGNNLFWGLGHGGGHQQSNGDCGAMTTVNGYGDMVMFVMAI